MSSPAFGKTSQNMENGLQTEFLAPGSGGFIALLKAFRATGGTAPSEIVDRLLAERPDSNAGCFAELIDTGQIFGFAWRAIVWIPMFQFEANGLALKANAQVVRAELPLLWSGWTLASWFAVPNARLDGRRPAELLDSEMEAVVQAARSLELVRDLARPHSRRAHEVSVHL